MKSAGNYTEDFSGGTYRCRVDERRVYDGPGYGYAPVEGAVYTRGLTAVLDNWYDIVGGVVWGRYIGICSGALRYIPVGPHTGAPDAARDFLGKV